MIAGQTAPLGCKHQYSHLGSKAVQARNKGQEQSVVLISLSDNAILAEKHPISQSRLWYNWHIPAPTLPKYLYLYVLEFHGQWLWATIHGTTPSLLHSYSYSTIAHNHIDNGR